MCTTITRIIAYGLAAGLLAHTASATETPETLMHKAQDAFDQADIVTAMSFYREAAEAGHAPAQTRLAYLLDNSEENEEAVAWYRRAAELGDAEGMSGLANMYAAGEGTTKDLPAAVQWYTLAAQQGHAPAIRALAIAYETGQLGLAISYAQAISWLQAGVDAADSWSIMRLARAWRRGELGLRIDREQAADLESRMPETGTDTGDNQ